MCSLDDDILESSSFKKEDKEFNVKIATLSQLQFSIGVYKTTTIQELKERIKSKSGFGPPYIIIYQNEELYDDFPLFHYNIQKDTTLYLVKKMATDNNMLKYIKLSSLESSLRENISIDPDHRFIFRFYPEVGYTSLSTTEERFTISYLKSKNCRDISDTVPLCESLSKNKCYHFTKCVVWQYFSERTKTIEIHPITPFPYGSIVFLQLHHKFFKTPTQLNGYTFFVFKVVDEGCFPSLIEKPILYYKKPIIPETIVPTIKPKYSRKECSICFDNFNKDRFPVILDCDHFFCNQCIQSIHDTTHSESIKCPKCREESVHHLEDM